MKEYTISSCSFNVKLDANSLDEARLKFKKEYPQYKYPEYFDCGDEENKVYGYCEGTGLPIFKHDTFQQDKEGIIWLTDNKYYKGVKP